ncbi:hypothetical protein [Anaeromicropila herbilytica]|uniref:Uncharacterized protein n=1 Tax=Anaeromicropila herbilytica TaxID=2785025 RepID=A0A7R7EI00_9FIRM|nr:hypothetical protein [Anaeromicropila herbilytica]BCN28787.1 hypothetical protein bsdtb5_00820 [Anaeromicropila herbilytica]
MTNKNISWCWNRLCDLVAVAYFAFLIYTLYIMFRQVLFMFCDIYDMLRGVDYLYNVQALEWVSIACFFFGISYAIPLFHRIYRVMPWFYVFTITWLVNSLIISLGYKEVQFGHKFNNGNYIIIYFILAIIQVILLRILMCWYLYNRPLKCFINQAEQKSRMKRSNKNETSIIIFGCILTVVGLALILHYTAMYS